MTHTPGPWKVLEWNDLPCIQYPVEDSVGWQYWVPQNLHYSNGNVADDARLIAAAPELLEALEELVELMMSIRDGDYQPDSFTCQPAEIAIRKAKGEQP